MAVCTRNESSGAQLMVEAVNRHINNADEVKHVNIVIESKSAIDIMTDDVAAKFFQAGRLHEKARQWEEAATSYQAAVRLRKVDNGDYNFRLCKALYEIGDLEKAEEAAKKAVELNPFAPHHHLYLGMIFDLRGNLHSAITSLGLAIDLQKITVAGFDKWHGRIASCFLRLKRYEEAEHHYRLAIELNHDNERYHLRLAEILLHHTRWQEGADALEKAAGLSEDPSSIYIRQAQALEKASKWEEAAGAYSDAIATALEPSANLYRDLASALRKGRKWWREIEALDRAVAMDPDDAESWFNLGNARDMMGRFAEAADAFQRAALQRPGNATWQYRLGYAWERAGNSHDAEIAYASAVKLEKRAGVQGIGWFHAQRGLWPAAVDRLKLQIPFHPLDAELYYRLGLANDRCYRWAEAAEAYLDALALSPDKASWHYRLGFVSERLGNWTQAAQAYERAVDCRADHSSYWVFRWGYSLHMAGEAEKAATIWLGTYPEEKPISAFGPQPESEPEPVPAPELTAEFEIDAQSIGDTHSEFDQSESAVASSETAEPPLPPPLPHYMDDISVRPIKMLERALSHDSVGMAGWVKLAEANEQCALWDDAADAYSQALARDGAQSATRHYRHGRALTAARRYDEACAAFLQMYAYRRPHGLELANYEKSASLREVMDYAECLETLPIAKDTIFYESYFGANISCNPFAIFERVVSDARYSHFKHIWVINDASRVPYKYRGMKNVSFIERGTRLYRKCLATSEYLINNVTFPPFFIRRPEQKYLNTWHGTPLKTLGKAQIVPGKVVEHKNVARNFLHATHLISANAHTTKVLIDGYEIGGLYKGKLAETGYPRQDMLFGTAASDRQKLFAQLGLDADRLAILYAPTWRGQPGQENTDIQRLVDDLQKMADTGVQILFRGHHMMEKGLIGVDIPVRVVPEHISTYEILPCIDGLIA
ncbi:MAG: CDP-glycerol glycerophosphotransferase family protein, partial [Sphingobium sp.]